MKRTKMPDETLQLQQPAVKRLCVQPALQQKANDFLNAKKVNTKALKEMVRMLKNDDSNAIGIMHTLEVVFRNLIKRQRINDQGKLSTSALYDEAWTLLLVRLDTPSKEESGVALKVCMQLLAVETKHPIAPHKGWPLHRLKQVLQTIINSQSSPPAALAHFEKYARCLDILEHMCKALPQLAPTSFKDKPAVALNYLAVVGLLDMSKSVLNAKQQHVETDAEFDYQFACKMINNIWSAIMSASTGIDEKIHKQVLVVLLERILPHLSKPVLLTDFLMDSLHQFDGPIALLALQGIFTLMQQQNITYPDVYEKLYSMFYPRMLFNKYKARLFYLADIFLTSTHLPENLVAAFVKRLARLALKSNTEDSLIMIRVICNLLLRHTGLQRLIHATSAMAAQEIVDPYDESEANPSESRAIDSSLWELVLLQKHAVPEVANAARFISSSLPTQEVDIGPLLEKKESDIFDDEVKKQAKQFAMGYERPKSLALPQHDIVTKYWDIV